SAAATLQRVLTEEPLRPRRLQPAVPRDLEAVCLRCLEKQPRRRFPSARELADDLRRFLKGEPTRTRPVGPLGRGWRWCRRKPTAAALVGVATLSLVTIAVGGLVASSHLSAALAHAQQLLYQSSAQAAEGEIAEGRVAQAVAYLDQCPPEL